MSTKDDELLDEIIGKLGCAANQIIPSDDQIIAGHVRDSVAMLLRFKHNRRAALAVARKAILEEAAKVASANEDKYQNPTEYDYGAQICSREIAAAIRSLANQEQTNG